MLKLKRYLSLCFLFILQIGVAFTQNNINMTPGTIEQLQLLLNNPTMVYPVIATPLGRNWFRLRTDIHVFTDQANLQQVAEVLLDLENQEQIYDGIKSKLTASIISRNNLETIVDFVSISIGPFGIQYRTPYRCSVRHERSDNRISVEFTQLASDSSSNRDMKNFYSVQYAEEVIIDGRRYTYIRILTISDVNAYIVPGAKGIFEREAVPVNIEGIQMIINAAKNRS
jgi:hypothetical protein